MIQLPKKRPWLILVFIYVVIISVWTTFIILGHKQGDRITPEEAELHIREQKQSESVTAKPPNKDQEP